MVEPGKHIVLAEGAFAALELEQELHSSTDIGPGCDAEVSHHCCTVNFGAFGLAGVLARQLCDTDFELVKQTMQRNNTAWVARRAVTSDEVVQVA